MAERLGSLLREYKRVGSSQPKPKSLGPNRGVIDNTTWSKKDRGTHTNTPRDTSENIMQMLLIFSKSISQDQMRDIRLTLTINEAHILRGMAPVLGLSFQALAHSQVDPK